MALRPTDQFQALKLFQLKDYSIVFIFEVQNRIPT